MESFFARLKAEPIYYEELNTQSDVYSAVCEYIEVFTIEQEGIQPMVIVAQFSTNDNKKNWLNLVSTFID